MKKIIYLNRLLSYPYCLDEADVKVGLAILEEACLPTKRPFGWERDRLAVKAG